MMLILSLFYQLSHYGKLVVSVKQGMDKPRHAVEETTFQDIRLDEAEQRTQKQGSKSVVLMTTAGQLVS